MVASHLPSTRTRRPNQHVVHVRFLFFCFYPSTGFQLLRLVSLFWPAFVATFGSLVFPFRTSVQNARPAWFASLRTTSGSPNRWDYSRPLGFAGPKKLWLAPFLPLIAEYFPLPRLIVKRIYCGWMKSCSTSETMGSHCLFGIYRAFIFQGFLGGRISCIHSMFVHSQGA